MALSRLMVVKTLRCVGPACMFAFPAGRPARQAQYLNPAQRVTQISLGLMDRGIVGAAWHGIPSTFSRVLAPRSRLVPYNRGDEYYISVRYTLITNRNNLYKILRTDFGAIGVRNLWLGSKEEIMKREMISMWALAGVLFAAVSLASVLQI